ncbi:unnamed protein product [Rotaria sordida]|uniref:Uncharacterized protein n=1 Tax=Rotaria sordida TaxID=392033 RepID=A0A818N8Z7_9BILA|nr:unnamed protein product [Rotaria sordida]CAF0804446.1 unnamed protein product [Rotaria sordida]CAF1396488.1 unnamed protein product [Rotaria sordida]CAF3602617.1 unnamed protein product [Rotaria sordida]
MSSSSTSFSLYSVKLARNCIPSLHLFSTPRQPTTITPNKWPVDLIEAVCIEAFELTACAELKGQRTNTTNNVPK